MSAGNVQAVPTYSGGNFFDVSQFFIRFGVQRFFLGETMLSVAIGKPGFLRSSAP